MINYSKLLKAEELGIEVPGLDSHLPPSDSFYHRDSKCSYLGEPLPKTVRELAEFLICSDCSERILGFIGGNLHYGELSSLMRFKSWLRKDKESPESPSSRYQVVKLLKAELKERQGRRVADHGDVSFAEVEAELEARYREIVKDLKIERDLTLKVIALETLALQTKRLEVCEELFKSTLKLLFKEWLKKISKSKSQEEILSGLTRTAVFHEGYSPEEAETYVKEVLAKWEVMLDEIQNSPDVIVGVTSNLFNLSLDRKEKMVLGVSTLNAESSEKQIMTMPAYAAQWLHKETLGLTLPSSSGSRYDQSAHCEIIPFTGKIPDGALEIACVLWEPRNRESPMFSFNTAVSAGCAL